MNLKNEAVFNRTSYLVILGVEDLAEAVEAGHTTCRTFHGNSATREHVIDASHFAFMRTRVEGLKQFDPDPAHTLVNAIHARLAVAAAQHEGIK